MEFGKIDNKELLIKIEKDKFEFFPDLFVIEMIDSYGMPVGKTIFETCVWIGKFEHAFSNTTDFIEYIYRKEEKMNICHTMRAKDSNIRQALIDRFGEVGTKKNPRLVLWI